MASPALRLIRSVPDPLALYVRAGRTDHTALLGFLATGDAAMAGLVFEAKRVAKQHELLHQVAERHLDAVLDPMTQQMATVGGYNEAMDDLPWSAGRAHVLADFQTLLQRRNIATQVAEFALMHGFSQVIAPTHLIRGPVDPWLQIDIEVFNLLRDALDRRGGGKVQIVYSLALSYEAFRSQALRQDIVAALEGINASGLWLRVEGCGSDNAGSRVIKYAQAASDFHVIGPVVADYMGGLMGLALLAFGAVGGLAHGVTLGERFATAHWHKRSEGTGFAQHTRVYLPGLDWQLPRVEAEKLFESGGQRAKAAFGCNDPRCCPRGIQGMTKAPARHFLYQRTREIGGLSLVPESLRPQDFLEKHVRPASDRALLATKLDLPENLALKALATSKRLDAMRIELGEFARGGRLLSHSMHPRPRIAREVSR